MVSCASSSGSKEALGTSAHLRLTQYSQLKTQLFVNSTLSSDMHLPSADQVWHIPAASLLPIVPLLRLPTPLLEHETSYFALSARIFSLSKIFPFTASPPSNLCSHFSTTRTFVQHNFGSHLVFLSVHCYYKKEGRILVSAASVN